MTCFRQTPLALALAMAAPLPSARAGDAGRVQPEVERTGPRLEANCRSEAFRAEESAGPGGGSALAAPDEPLVVSPGTWWVVLRCPDLSGIEVPIPGPRLVVAAGDHLRPKVRARAAPLRVVAFRNGERVSAEVVLRLSGLDRPVKVFEAYQTTWVGRGPWRLQASLSQDEDVAAEIQLPSPKWRKGRKTTVVRADFSDGQVQVIPRLNSRPTGALLKVVSTGRTITGPSERPLSLPPGPHRLEVTLLEAADFARQVVRTTVRPRRKSRVVVDFRGGFIDVGLVRERRPLRVAVQLARAGAGKAFNFIQAPGRALVRPGKYKLWIEGDIAGPPGRFDLASVEVAEKKVVEVRRDLTLVALHLDAKGYDRDELEVRYAGGGENVESERPYVWRLWPGSYEVVARSGNGFAVVDGPFTVEFGDRTIRRHLRKERFALRLSAAKAEGVSNTARFVVYRAGAGQPIAEGALGSAAFVGPGVYDVRAEDRGRTAWFRAVEVRKDRELVVHFEEVVPAADLPQGDADEPGPEDRTPP